MSASSPLPPQRTAFIAFPGADYTHSAAVDAARRILTPQRGWEVVDALTRSSPASTATAEGLDVPPDASLYFTDYDLLPFDRLLPSSSSSGGAAAQCSSYVIRKALIRKHYLAHALHSHAVKRGRGGEQNATPRTWSFEIQWADELDELLQDDLYDVDDVMERNLAAIEAGDEQAVDEVQWFILKPGMADRGNGIRLFATRDQLQRIFEEFEPDSDDDDDDEEEDGDGGEEDASGAVGTYKGRDTSVMASQLRHFVIQEYIDHPLLLSPPCKSILGLDGSRCNDVESRLSALRLSSAPPASAATTTTAEPTAHGTATRTLGQGRKFHLRAYVLCVGALRVYLHDEMLALFAPLPYSAPTAGTYTDLRAHLTNTCLQPSPDEADEDAEGLDDGRVKEDNVWSWDDLVSSSLDGGEKLTADEVDEVNCKSAAVIGDVFEACAKAGSIHWQMWPNAWEIFGVDLLVSRPPSRGQMEVKLLEINAQPDFAQTGARLQRIVSHLFERVLELAVLPFFPPPGSEGDAGERDEGQTEWMVGESRDGMTLCFSEDFGR